MTMGLFLLLAGTAPPHGVTLAARSFASAECARPAADVFDAVVATEETPETEQLKLPAILAREGRDPAIAIPYGAGSIA